MPKVQFFPGGALANARAMIKAIEKGMTESGLSDISYTPGCFPVNEVPNGPKDIPPGWVTDIIVNHS